MQLKHMLQGVAVAMGGASVWLFFYLSWLYRERDRFLVVLFCTFSGALISCVYTVPLGAALGLILPPYCLRHSTSASLLAGAAAGVGTGVLSSLLVAAIFQLNFQSVFVSMAPFCVLLLALWASLLCRERARKISDQARPNPAGPSQQMPR